MVLLLAFDHSLTLAIIVSGSTGSLYATQQKDLIASRLILYVVDIKIILVDRGWGGLCRL